MACLGNNPAWGNALIFASIVKSSSAKGGTVCMGDSGIKRTMANNRLALNCKACEIFREEMSQKYNRTFPAKNIVK